MSRYTYKENGLGGRVFGRETAWEVGDPESNRGLALVCKEEDAKLFSSAPDAVDLIRRMAERFDGASNGKCLVCGVGRKTDRWATGGFTVKPLPPAPCPNSECLSHEIRTFILNAER